MHFAEVSKKEEESYPTQRLLKIGRMPVWLTYVKDQLPVDPNRKQNRDTSRYHIAVT